MAGLPGGVQGGDADGASPSLATVLQLVRCVLQRRSKRVGGRASGTFDVPCFLSLQHLTCLLAEVKARPAACAGGGGGAPVTTAEALLDILLLTPVRWLVEDGRGGGGCTTGDGEATNWDSERCEQICSLASWMLQSCWPAHVSSAATAEGSEGQELHVPRPDVPGHDAAVQARGEAALPDILHPGVHAWDVARVEEVKGAQRREKVLRWMTALAAAHDGVCDRILRLASHPKGLLRAVLFLYRTPAPSQHRLALLSAINSFLAVITARAALLAHRKMLLLIDAEEVGTVRTVLSSLGDSLPDPTDMGAPAPADTPDSAVRSEALALFFRWLWSGQSLSRLKSLVGRLSEADEAGKTPLSSVAAPARVLLDLW